MGKNNAGGSSSWLSAVKKAFRSPNKDANDKRSCRSEDLEQQEQEKKRGKRRWIFGKSLSNDKEKNQTVKVTNSVGPGNAVIAGTVKTVMEAETVEEEKLRAIEVAIATTNAAEAAVATAQAAVQFIRMSKPFISIRETKAALIIQKAFRGYLARKALNALKGLVKLQALARGHNVRKRTTLTLARMQAVIRVQSRVCDQRRRLSVSREGSINSSCFTDKNQMSKDGESDENQSVEKEIDSFSMPGMIKDAERDLAYAFSDKIWNYHVVENSGSGRPAKPECTDNCRETKPWDRPGRYSCDQRTPIKILQVEEPDRRDPYQHTRFSSYLNQFEPRKSLPVASFGSPVKPYGPVLKYLQVHSASPRCLREEESRYPKSKTPNLGSFRPSYMAETESAKARARSQSVPRHQRPSTPEREATGIAKRCLFFGASDNVASPSRGINTRIQR